MPRSYLVSMTFQSRKKTRTKSDSERKQGKREVFFKSYLNNPVSANMSQTMISVSFDPDANLDPESSSSNAKAVTAFACPLKATITVEVLEFHNRIDPSAYPTAKICFERGERVMQVTSKRWPVSCHIPTDEEFMKGRRRCIELEELYHF